MVPLFASTTAISLFAHMLNRRPCELSRARPVGSSHGAKDHVLLTVSVLASKAMISLLFAMFTYTAPFPSVTASSGLPSNATVPTTFPDAASIAVALSVAQMIQYWLRVIPFSDTSWALYTSVFLKFSR